MKQEMYFRHLYATVQPTLEQRCDSWDNYCALFNVILSSNINMQVCFILQQLLDAGEVVAVMFMLLYVSLQHLHCPVHCRACAAPPCPCVSRS